MGSRDVFDVFSTSTCQTSLSPTKIPHRLWRQDSSKSGSINSKCCKIRSFDYDLDNECFTTCKQLEVHSLFFNFVISKPRYSHDDFFVINFVSRAPVGEDSSQIAKDTVVEHVLRSGVTVSGNVYNIVGCSNSGVQKRSFYFMRGSVLNCSNLLKSFIPDLDELARKKGVAKRTKYAGLLFTGCQYIVDLPKEFKIKVVKDVEKGEYNFTDGCGFISFGLAEKIWKTHENLSRKWKRVPSVWQIRYCGSGHICKGVLVVDYREKSKMVMTVRKSLIKVNSAKDGDVDKHLRYKLGIVATSLKPKVGKLNKQTVALLSVNVNEDVMISLQSEYLEHVSNARKNPIDALHCYALKNQLNLYQQLLRNHAVDIVPPAYLALPNHVEGLPSEKLTIPLACSRLLLGASFPECLGNLREGQCVVLDEFGFVKGNVVVCRSPSYAPGDLQVLEAIALPPDHPVSEMRNVILFGTKGSRPDPDKMSGGDLDGDLYLVIWDERILNFSYQISSEPSQEYEAPPKAKDKKLDEDWIRYVAVWENSMLAQIDSCFFQLAAEKGVKSPECIRLCGLFSRAVDQHPSDLQELKKLISGCSGRKNEGSPFLTRSEDIPLWERLMGKQIELFEDIKRNRESAPTKIEWDSFYGKILAVEKSKLSDLLSHCDIVACSSKELRAKLITVWQKLSSNSLISNFRVMDPPCLEGTQHVCTFDCKIKSCQSQHPTATQWHHDWSKRMRLEMNVFIEPFKRELEQHRNVVVKQDRLLAKALELFQIKYTEITEKQQKCRMRHAELSQHSCDIQQAENLLTSLQVQAIPDGFTAFKNAVENRMANIFLGRDRKRSKWEMEVMEKINAQEDVLSEALNECSLSLLREDWVVELKPDFVNEILREKESSRMVAGISNLMTQIQQHFESLKTPDINDVVNQYQNILGEIHICTSKIEEMVNNVQEKEKLETNLLLQCSDLADQAQTISQAIDTLKTSNSEPVFGIGEENDYIIMNQVKEIKRQKLLTLESELDQIEREKERLLLHVGLIQSALSQLNHEIICVEAKKKSLETMLSQSYNGVAHKTASDAIIVISEQTKSFDLALCALLNEVNVRHRLFPDMSSFERATLNKELHLCLSREKNRCEREQSDKKLPVFSKRCDLLDKLRESDVVIVVAQTGSGKSTQIPQYLADDLHHIIDCGDKFPKIVCTQPRRVAATGIANRVALEYSGSVSVSKNNSDRCEPQPEVHNSRIASTVAYPLYASSDQRALDELDRVGCHETVPNVKFNHKKDEVKVPPDDLRGTPGEVGGWVGYQIGSRGKSDEDRKNSKKCCPDTRIEFVTEGLLLQKLKQQQDTTNYQCIIIDEAHERGKDTDLLLALLRLMVLKNSCKVKVVVMSASIDQRQFSNYFGGCPILECEGKMFEVDVFYKPIPETSSSNDDSSDEDDVDVKISPVISHAVDVLFSTIYPNKDLGDVLIFLPGMLEIHTCVDLIRQRAEEDWDGKDPPAHVRKVVCCTNIAETSLTIPGVRYVIDAGQAKKIAYDHQLRVTTLQLQQTSQASAKQRKGRAGRVQPGTCYRLCSEEDFSKLREFDEPEMKQCPIDELYLYTLDVFGSMKDLYLMPDAQPDPESLLSARERLLNLRFVQQQDDVDVVINEDGKLALMLCGEVSLEGVRMILSAREYGVVKEAVILAVLLQHASDLMKRVKETSPLVEENRKKYLDELGDHFMLLKVYEEYEKRKSDTRKVTNWCKEAGFCLQTLKQVRKSIDSVYQTLKRSKMLGKVLDEPLSQSETKMYLCKVIIAGFFHNIAELHDVEYLKAGYSMLTPSSMMPADNYQTEDIHLLKVHLPNQCTLFTQGDVVDNTYVIFTKLYKTSFGKVLMLQTCRIQPDWIIDNASARWQHMVGLTVEQGKLKSFVTREQLCFIGPQILAALVKSNERQYIKTLEAESGSAVNFMFEAAEIRCYGSQCEINAVLSSSLVADVKNKKLEFINSDSAIPFRTGRQEEPLCMIQSGLCVDKLIIPWANHVYKWSLIQSQIILFRKLPEGKSNILLSAIEDLKKNCHDVELIAHWGTPVVVSAFTDKSGVHCCKLKFEAQDVAQYVVRRFTKDFASRYQLWETHCFEDNEVRIRVLDSKLYPSVFELAQGYPSVAVHEQKNSFTFKLKNKKVKDLSPVKQFLEDLDQRETFASACLKDVDIGLPKKNYTFVSEQLRLLKERVEASLSAYKGTVYLQLTPNPWFEVFGDHKAKFINELKREIKKLKFDVINENFSFVYFKRHCLQRHQLSHLLQRITVLRSQYPKVNFTIAGVRDSDKVMSSVEILTKSAPEGRKASNEVLRLIASKAEIARNEDETEKCVVCKKKVTIRKGRKKKEGDGKDIIVHLDDDEVVGRLTLCGCIFCSSCLHMSISEHLLQLGTPVKCPTAGCSQIILNRDIRDHLSRDMVNELQRDAVVTHLTQWANTNTIQEKEKARARGEPLQAGFKVVIDRCPNRNCQQIVAHRFERGVYRCPSDSCHGIFCCKCGANVHNEAAFNYHVSERCVINDHFCTLL